MPSRKHFDKEELTYLYEVRHMTVNGLARHYGCERRTVSRALASFGITVNPYREGLNVDTEVLVREYLVEELSIREIADKYDASYGGIWKRLNDAKVPFRSRGGSRGGPKER